MLGSIPQHSLHRARVRFGDDRTLRGSLFPFFDDSGTTRAVMLTTDRDGRIHWLDFEQGVVSPRRLPSLFRSHRVALDSIELKDCGSSFHDLRHLWHFDPWWELSAQRYFGHPAVPALKETNLPGHDDGVSGIWFDPALSRVTWLGLGAEETIDVRRFTPDLLATARRRRKASPRQRARRPERRPGWRLRPFWQAARPRQQPE